MIKGVADKCETRSKSKLSTKIIFLLNCMSAHVNNHKKFIKEKTNSIIDG